MKYLTLLCYRNYTRRLFRGSYIFSSELSNLRVKPGPPLSEIGGHSVEIADDFLHLHSVPTWVHCLDRRTQIGCIKDLTGPPQLLQL